MIFSKILKKTTLAIAMTASLGAMTVNAVEMNELDNDVAEKLKTEILYMFTGNTDHFSTIENMKQIGNSDNYIFKYQENGEYYTMVYMEDIKSVMIQSGEIFSLNDKKFITKDFNSSFSKTLISKLDLNESVTFASTTSGTPLEIYAFTDPTCGYCQKLHREVKEYQDLGISIHYFPFPRGGLQGYGYNQLVNIACSADPKEAMETAKMKGEMPLLDPSVTAENIQECKALVKKYYDLGNRMGVRGTPALFSANGTKLGGYVPAQNLIHSLEDDLKNNK